MLRIAVAVIAALAVVAVPAATQAATTPAVPAPQTVCTRPGQPTGWAQAMWHYIVHADAWQRTVCLRETRGKPNYRTTTTIRAGTGVVAFPDVLYGWSWGLGSKDSALPLPLTQDSRLTVSWTFHGHPAGIYNEAADIWLAPKPLKSGQNMAEVMIWTGTRGYSTAFRDPAHLVTVDGARWYLDEWTTCHAAEHACWPLIILDRQHPVASVRDLPLRPFLNLAVRRHWAGPGWYLNAIEAGDEINSASPGLSLAYFRVKVKP